MDNEATAGVNYSLERFEGFFGKLRVKRATIVNPGKDKRVDQFNGRWFVKAGSYRVKRTKDKMAGAGDR